MKNFKKIILIFFYSLIFFSNAIAIENKILFKVNNEIITSIDILTELKYLGTINNDLNKMPKKQAFEIAKKSLIREKIKEIELKKIFKEITVEDKFLNNLLVNHFESDEIKSIYDFEKYFLLLDISPNLIKKKISIEVMWNRFIFNKFNQNVKINKEVIKNELLTKDKQKRAAAAPIDKVAEPPPALALTTSVPAFWMRGVKAATSSSVKDVPST